MSNDLRAILTRHAQMYSQLAVELPHGVKGPGMLERFILEHANVSGLGHGKMPAGMRKGPPKECFSNAATFADAAGKYTYCEGYAMRNDGVPFPFLHAWLLNRDEQIIDPTLRAPHDYQYLGITIPHDLLWKQLSKNEVYGVLDPGMGINVEFIEGYKAGSK